MAHVSFQEFEECCNQDSNRGKRKVISSASVAVLFCELRDYLKPWSWKEERMMNIMVAWFFFRTDIPEPPLPPVEDGIARHWREEAEGNA